MVATRHLAVGAPSNRPTLFAHAHHEHAHLGERDTLPPTYFADVRASAYHPIVACASYNQALLVTRQIQIDTGRSQQQDHTPRSCMRASHGTWNKSAMLLGT